MTISSLFYLPTVFFMTTTVVKGSSGGTLGTGFRWMSLRHEAVNRVLLMIRSEMGIAPRHTGCPMAKEFSNRAQSTPAITSLDANVWRLQCHE